MVGGQEQRSKAGPCGCLWLLALSRSALSERKRPKTHNMTTVWRHRKTNVSLSVSATSGELTCPPGNPAEKRFLLSAPVLLLYRIDVTLWRYLECNSYFCLKSWHECAPPACAPRTWAPSIGGGPRPEGRKPLAQTREPSPETPSMHAHITPHLVIM